ncbi:MAG: hypothetical protein RL693_1068 [Verrucomicrobiota bacterium]
MKGAVKTALQITKFGRGIEGSEATLICYLVAITTRAYGERTLEPALICGNADFLMLEGVQGELAALEPSPQDLIASLKVDALYSKNLVKAFKSGAIEAISFEDPHPGFKKLFLKPNYIQASDMRFTKPLVVGFSVSWEEGWHSSQKVKKEYEKFSKDWWKFWCSPNVYGNLITKKSMPTYEKMFEKALINVVMSRQSIIMLAMRRYELEQGKLPVTLEELVPKYLPAVPTDPFDDAPMRWNPEKKVIYSVGEDGKDDVGKIDPVRRKRGQTFNTNYDVSMIYWGSEEAAQARLAK